MALFPRYGAFVNQTYYQPLAGWTRPSTYERVTSLAGHDDYPPYSVTLAMHPVMEPFASSEFAALPNDGIPASGAYAQREYYPDTSLFALTPNWSVGKLLQVQIPKWQQSYENHAAWRSAFLVRSVEDTWITERMVIEPAVHEAELALLLGSDFEIKSDSITIHDSWEVASGRPKPVFVGNACEMKIQWRAELASFRVLQTTEHILAFYDPAPELEAVTWEAYPGGTYAQTSTLSLGALAGEYSGLVNRDINGFVYQEIQPWQYDLSSTAMRRRTAVASDPAEYTAYFPVVLSEAQALAMVEDFYVRQNSNPLLSSAIVDEAIYVPPSLPRFYTTTDWGNTGNAVGSPFTAATISVGGSPLFNFLKVAQANDRAPGDVSPVNQFSAIAGLVGAHPMRWDHTDPEFIGYVPYTQELWEDQRNYLIEYAKEQDDRFDGFYFQYKIKASKVTRSWQGFMRNELISSTGFFSPAAQCSTIHSSWVDSITGEVTPAPVNYCSLSPEESITDWMTPELLGPIEVPYDWGSYPWPDISITIPGGSFLLTDGSDAPIYPDFHGAYVYDLHLKKWGKYQGEYKRLIDYAAINTFLPGEQSYSRFGIFGGVLQEDGTIRLFDARPSDSKIVYGKIGYYRQGMTSPEEVRVHMRTPSTGTLELESSVEGKLITAGFGQSWDFASEVSWIGYGGYSAKWHNIVVKGQFDISYLEFRGITSGRR